MRRPFVVELRFAVLSWILATAVLTATPILLASVAPELPRPPAFAIGFLAGGLVLYPLARRTAERQAGSLPFWKFFPAPFAGAVFGLIMMGLLGG